MTTQFEPDGATRMQAYYAARANEYDRIYLTPERQADLAKLRAWLPPLFAGTRLLELACGTGYWTQFIAPAAHQVLALDTAPETLSIAKTRVPCANVQFLTGDAYAPRLVHGRFSAAFAGFWFSHVPVARRQAFFGGLAGVLEPGARVVLIDNLYVEGSSTPISETDADGNTYQIRHLDNGSSHRVLKNFPDQAALQAAIAGAGRDGVFTRFDYFWAFEFLMADRTTP